jgi:hypothetical protein
MSHFFDVLSIVIGWTYVICWASSFYPIVYEVVKLKRFAC